MRIGSVFGIMGLEINLGTIALGILGLALISVVFLYLAGLRRDSRRKKVGEQKRIQQVVEAENLTNVEKILLEILESSRESAFVLKRFLFAAKVTAAILLIGLAINVIVALNN